jgi:hypothetical protein
MSEAKGRKRRDVNNDVEDRKNAMEDATPQRQSPIEEMGSSETKPGKKKQR